MYAVVADEPGGPEVLRWAEVGEPNTRTGEVLVDVVASAVNRADILQRLGRHPPPAGAPPYPGLECSGYVAAVGVGVQEWQVGDEVCALLGGGGYAERVVVPAGQLLPVPDGVAVADAAALPEVMCTVHSNLAALAGLTPGETLLVHGGAGGIGTAAIQLGRYLGARVLCTAGTAEKLARCRELGAEVAINYRAEDFAERVREETSGAGADVILDVVGAAYLPRNVHALATGGRLMVIGLMGGAQAELDLGALLSRRAAVQASTLRARPPEEKARIVAGVRSEVWPAVAAGWVRPVIDRVVAMRDAPAAHRTVEAGEHVGKVLLRA